MIALHEVDLEPVILPYMKISRADLWPGSNINRLMTQREQSATVCSFTVM